jgi:hypothetical protein
MTPEQRLARNIIVRPDGCWEYQRYVNHGGYGVIGVGRGTKLTHVVMWESINGPKPPGMVLDHVCHNRSDCTQVDRACLHRRCCNPDHLELKTQRANSDASPRSWQNRTHCGKGHEFTPENTLTRNDGRSDRGRRCRECERQRTRRRSRTPEWREYHRAYMQRRRDGGYTYVEETEDE